MSFGAMKVYSGQKYFHLSHLILVGPKYLLGPPPPPLTNTKPQFFTNDPYHRTTHTLTEFLIFTRQNLSHPYYQNTGHPMDSPLKDLKTPSNSKTPKNSPLDGDSIR